VKNTRKLIFASALLFMICLVLPANASTWSTVKSSTWTISSINCNSYDPSLKLDSNQATACAIGSVTFTELVYYGYRPGGSGPGGVAVSPRYVANTTLPVGVTLHHLCYEVEVALDADEVAWELDFDFFVLELCC
jgi:hypothetical protein